MCVIRKSGGSLAFLFCPAAGRGSCLGWFELDWSVPGHSWSPPTELTELSASPRSRKETEPNICTGCSSGRQFYVLLLKNSSFIIVILTIMEFLSLGLEGEGSAVVVNVWSRHAGCEPAMMTKFPVSEQRGTELKGVSHIPTPAKRGEEWRHDSRSLMSRWEKLFSTLGCLLTNL